MKRICYIFFCFFIFFSGLAFESSAASSDSLGTKKLVNHPILSKFNLVEGYEDYTAAGYQVFGVLPLSTADARTKEYMQKFFDVITGKNTEYRAFLYYVESMDTRFPSVPPRKLLQFCLTKPESTSVRLFTSSVSESVFWIMLNEIEHRMVYDFASNSFSYFGAQPFYLEGAVSNTPAVYTSNILYGTYVIDELIKTGYLARCGKDIISYYPEDLILVDDDGLLPAPELPSEPEEPVPPPATDFPVIEKTDNEYVPYDTTVWNSFLSKIKTALGNATNVGFVIFGILFSIGIVIKIVKMFTRM